MLREDHVTERSPAASAMSTYSNVLDCKIIKR